QISIPSTAATTQPLDQSERRTPLRFRRRATSQLSANTASGGLSFERVADSVVANCSDAFRQGPSVTLGLDLKQAGNLHGCTQEDGIQHLLPRVLWELPALRPGAHQIRKAEHLIEISLEPVPAQVCRLSLFLSSRNRFRLMPQMEAAAESNRRRISTFSRTFSASSAGMLRAFGLPSIRTEIWYWECRFSPSAQRQLGRPQARWRSTNEPGSISRREPRLRMSLPRSSRSGSRGILI